MQGGIINLEIHGFTVQGSVVTNECFSMDLGVRLSDKEAKSPISILFGVWAI